MLPEEVSEGYFAEWHKSQQRYAEQVEAAFSPVPILNSRLFDHEIVGLANLRELADSLFGDIDPSAILYDLSLIHIYSTTTTQGRSPAGHRRQCPKCRKSS